MHLKQSKRKNRKKAIRRVLLMLIKEENVAYKLKR